MKRLSTIITWVFLSGILLSELPIIVNKLCPQTAEIEYNLFMDWDYGQKITVLWYLYELAALVNRMIWAYAFCKIAGLVSDRLFRVGMTFVFYYASQFVFYLWDRNSTGLSNLCVIICVVVVLVTLCLPDKKKGKIKSIE